MLTILILALVVLQGQTAPLGAETAPTILHTILFKRQAPCECSQPLERTLTDIIRSCLLTIAACVYRAIHQNIPDPNASWGARQWVRIKITFFALVAPEAVLWWAMRQWAGAKAIADEVNKIKPELKWTRTHGHFAQMGGLGRKDNQKILYPPTLIDLLRSNKIGMSDLRLVTQKHIQDKSKGDALSKLVVGLQTTWFVFECLARYQQKLPVTELEVVTLAFAVLNGFMYGLWWNKPLNVACTIYIDVRDEADDQQAESEPIVQQKSTVVESPFDHRSNTLVSETETLLGQVSSEKDLKERGGWRTARDWLIASPLQVFDVVWRVIETFGRLFDEHEVDDEAAHISSFYAMESRDDDDFWIPFASAFIGMLFGAVHFLSWSAPFPTHAEQLLWRISTIVLVATPPALGILGLASEAFTKTQFGSMGEMISSIMGIGLVLVAPVCYILARFCLLVLAFLTLQNLSPAAFQAVIWTSYIPHF
ncbi:hypothetical protein BDN72DRAFT_958776 [Pluteus cervinus]|uniref:Uncharacterized protein n=1 Tax=Pluteus cervinus TaxID=181527 RepID=A0ACD3AXN2_9AGAR|nr:hypothetical protein BDN72DRAFT_958776 [Pluteus cervinus]